MEASAKFGPVAALAVAFALSAVGGVSCDSSPDGSSPTSDATELGGAEPRDGGEVGASDASDATDVEDVDTGSNCHTDCFRSGYRCVDGTVWRLVGGPVPCRIEFPGPVCSDFEVGTCESSCRTDRKVTEGLDGGSADETVLRELCDRYGADATDAADSTDTTDATDVDARDSAP